MEVIAKIKLGYRFFGPPCRVMLLPGSNFVSMFGGMLLRQGNVPI